MCVCVRACVRECVRACVCEGRDESATVHAAKIVELCLRGCCERFTSFVCTLKKKKSIFGRKILSNPLSQCARVRVCVCVCVCVCVRKTLSVKDAV